MPVYNGEKYLEDSIASVLSQTFTNFEFIIINDGSSDKSLFIIQSYQFKDNRIVVVDRENKGLVSSLNEGVSIAKGEYIARMDQDDICFPDRLKRQLKFLSDNQNIDVCGTWAEVFGYGEGILKMPKTDAEIKVYMLSNPGFVHPSVLGRKSFFTDLKYDQKYTSAEDYDLWVRGFDKYCYANIPLPLIYYREHNSQTNSAEQRVKARQIRARYLQKLYPNISDSDIFIFNKVIDDKYVSRRSASKLFYKILNENIKTLSSKKVKEGLISIFYSAMHDDFLSKIIKKIKKIVSYWNDYGSLTMLKNTLKYFYENVKQAWNLYKKSPASKLK